MGKLCQEFLDLDEILPYDKGELQVWNLTDSHLEEVINYVFDNEVKNSNGDTNSREPVGSESDQDSWYHTDQRALCLRMSLMFPVILLYCLTSQVVSL